MEVTISIKRLLQRDRIARQIKNLREFKKADTGIFAYVDFKVSAILKNAIFSLVCLSKSYPKIYDRKE